MDSAIDFLRNSFGFIAAAAFVVVFLFGLRAAVRNQNQKWFYQWADLILTGLLAATAFFGFKNKELAEFVALAGILVVTARITFSATVFELFESEMTSAFQPLRNSVEKVSGEMNYIRRYFDFEAVEDLRKLNDAYLHVTEDLFHDAKKVILADASKSLNKLAKSKRADDLNTTDYYKALFRALDSANGESRIFGISFFRSFEWDDSEQEQTFIKKQLEAAARGALTERVFILKDDAKVEDLAKIPAIALHAKEVPNSISGYTVREKQIPAAVRKGLGNGFIIISNKAILFDSENETDPTEVVGSVCTDREEIEKHISVFRNLNTIRTELTFSNLRGSTALVQAKNGSRAKL